MSSATPPSGAQFAMSARILSSSLIGALLFIGVSLIFVLPTDEMPQLWVPLAQVAAGIAVHFVLETVGYRVRPLDLGQSDDDAASAGRLRWQNAMILRFALCEFVALASVAAAFLLHEGGFTVYAVGGLVSLVLMLVHVWPWARPVGRTADALEANGKASHLRETFGLASQSGGGIQRL